MARPSVSVTTRDSTAARGLPSDTGVWFVAGLTERGSVLAPIPIRGMADYDRLLGARVSYGMLYDAMEEFFKDGGNLAYVSRVLGATPTTALLNLSDGSVNSLEVKANSPGLWGTSIRVQVIAGDAGGEFKLVFSTVAAGELERTPSLVDKAAAVAWAAAASNYVILTDLGVGGDPAVAAATALSSATDDQGTIADAHWLAALNRFNADLGPGQVSAPGSTSGARHLQLTAHGAANNRTPLLDGADTIDPSTIIAQVTAARDANARTGGLFAPWVKIAGLSSGTTRDVPPSALVAALMARNDVANTPNDAAAGDNGISRNVQAVKVKFTDAQLDALSDGGVNVIRDMPGGIRLYGYRTLVNPVTSPGLIQLTKARLVMALKSELKLAGETFVFDQIDGKGRKISEYQGALIGVLLPYYTAGSLYGATPEEAFYVDTGPGINLPETIAAGELRASISVRVSPFGEQVKIDLVTRAITEAVA